MRKTLNYDFLNVARNMPPLRHTTGQRFDIKNSEVARWLAAQPEILQKLFDMAVNKKVIVFDPVTKEWKGADYLDA